MLLEWYTVNLDVNEFGALESVVFIPNGVILTEPTGSEFPGGVGVAAQFNVQAVESKGLCPKEWMAYVEVRVSVEGGVEESECIEFGDICWDSRECAHHLRYSPWISSLRWVVDWEGRVVSVSLKWCSILHALDHQVNLDLEAMAF